MIAASGVESVDYGDHAVERYGDRLRPAALAAGLRREIRAVAAAGGAIVTVPPIWAAWDAHTDAYLQIGEDIIFPLIARRTGYFATTCLIRGWCPPSVRAARRGARAAARRRRRRGSR
jgi:hypothetical protein